MKSHLDFLTLKGSRVEKKCMSGKTFFRGFSELMQLKYLWVLNILF